MFLGLTILGTYAMIPSDGMHSRTRLYIAGELCNAIYVDDIRMRNAGGAWYAGQPSQTYCQLAEKEYYSTKHELIRIATSGEDLALGDQAETFVQGPTLRDSVSETGHSHLHAGTLLTLDPHSQAEGSASCVRVERDTNHHASHFSHNAHIYLNSPPSRRPGHPISDHKDHDGDPEDSSDDDTDIFYTPRSTVYSSPRASRQSSAMMLEPQALANALLPLHPRSSSPEPDSPSVSRTPSDSSISSAGSSSSGHDDNGSLFSSPSRITSSTRMTTPNGSDRGVRKASQELVETITITSSSRPRGHAAARSATSSTLPSSSRSMRRRSREEAQLLMYTDEDWAKDVRWLAPPKIAQSQHRHSRTLPPDFYLTVPSVAPSYSRPGTRSRAKADRTSKHSRTSRGRMSALWEEDESECSTTGTGLSSSEPSRAPTPVLETPRSTPPSPLAQKALTAPLSSSADHSAKASEPDSPSPDARLLEYARGHRRTLSSSSSPGPTSIPTASTAKLPTHTLPTPFPAMSPSSPQNGYTSLTLPHAGYANAKGKTTAEGHVDLVRAGIAQSSMATIEVIRGASAIAPLPSNPKKGRAPSATPMHLQGALPLPVAFTAHLAPPTYVPESHVLVQVFAVGLDGLDSLIVYEKSGGAPGSGVVKGAGFVPGRSFVGRAVECGWKVKEEVCKRGEWVLGLLDVRKVSGFPCHTAQTRCSALAEFILVERHRVHRAPQPRPRNPTLFPARRRTHARAYSLPTSQHSALHSSQLAPAPSPLTLEELALLPLSGIFAHRAIRTFGDVLTAFARYTDDSARRPRALILHGHDGAGAMAVQMLGRRGVSVSVQVPQSAVRDDAEDGATVQVARSGAQKSQACSRSEQVEARLRSWGAEGICIGEPLDVLGNLADEGESFDMILDTVGGVAIWEAAQQVLLLDPSATSSASSKSTSVSLSSTAESAASVDMQPGRSQTQFTTLVGDTPGRAIPTAHDNLRSGLRSLRRAMGPTKGAGQKKAKEAKRSVGYTWVSVAVDVDFEGEDIRDSLDAVVAMAEQGWLRPWIGQGEEDADEGRVVPFERAPEVFRRSVTAREGSSLMGEPASSRLLASRIIYFRSYYLRSSAFWNPCHGPSNRLICRSFS
ncbi:hypothetical protein A0H81_08180 [Grifola frondosa]|uniref:Uncharacterized protein n=1 Tax=Grifola frondosa TaxID=5627 RepID=A0A1C7M4Y6_GRIFR|nr:hypothetical protein A0H81_08180 [Grifola frondosa]